VNRNVRIMQFMKGGIEWAMSDGTSLSGDYILMDGTAVDAAVKA
jgi:hypothetical protein